MTLAYSQAIGAYRDANRAIHPVKAVTLLLDEVLNSLILTNYYLRKDDFESAFNRVVTASKILGGLRQNVNLDADPQMGQQFIDMYSKNIFALHNSYGKPDAVERFAGIASGLVTFRNAWAEMAHVPQRSIDSVMAEILDQKSESALSERA